MAWLLGRPFSSSGARRLGQFENELPDDSPRQASGSGLNSAVETDSSKAISLWTSRTCRAISEILKLFKSRPEAPSRNAFTLAGPS